MNAPAREQQVAEATPGADGIAPDANLDAQPAGESLATAEAMYDIDGERVPLSQIKDWRGGYMKDADYRKKTSEIADQRKEHETYQGKMKPYEAVIDFLAERPEGMEKVNTLLKEMWDAEQGGAEVQNPKLTQQVNSMQERLEDIELEKNLNALKANPAFAEKFKTPEDETAFLKYVQKESIGNLTTAAKSYFYDSGVAGAKMAGQDAVTQGLKDKADVKQPPGSNGAGIVNPPKADPRKQTMDQNYKQVEADLFPGQAE